MSPVLHSFDVCILGNGITGHALALLLAQQRLKVGLIGAGAIAASAPHAPFVQTTDVRAYAINETSKKLLQSLRVWDADNPSFATPVHAMQIFGDGAGLAQGRVHFHADVMSTTPANEGEKLPLTHIVDVPLLAEQLAKAVHFQPFITCVTPTGAPPDAQGMPSNVRCDLLAICEGKNSTTRQTLGIAVDDTPYHHTAIATRVVGTQPHHNTARQWFGADGEVCALLPMQGNQTALVWSVSNQKSNQLAALSDADFCQVLHQTTQGALGELESISARTNWPLHLKMAKQWTGQHPQLGAWILAGDAAHSVHPLSGQGLNCGLADVLQLSNILAQRPYWRAVNDKRLLREYERSRQWSVQRLGCVTDGLQQLFACPAPAQHLRNSGMWVVDQSPMLKRWLVHQAMH